MAKVINEDTVEYDVTGVEESRGGTGVKVKPGVKVARIDLAEIRTEKANGDPANDIRLGLNFGDEFDWGFTYIGLGESTDWKLAEFTRALGLKDKSKLSLSKHAKGKFIRVKVNSGSYNGDYSPDIGRLMKAQPGDEALWEEGNTGVSETSSQASGPDADDITAGEPEGPPRWREGELDPEDPNETVGPYDGWSDEDVEAEVADRGLTLPGGRGSKRNKMIAALRSDDAEWREAGAAEESATAVAEGAADAAADDYDDWDLDRLKKEWAERELGALPAVRGNNAEARLITKLIEGIRADDEANPFDS